MIEQLQELVRLFYINLSEEQQARIVSSLVILLVLLVARFVALRFAHRRYREKTRALYNARKVVQYATVGLGILLIGRLWLEGVQSMATYLGLLSAGLAIALQDPLVNMAGWLFIIARRPFVVGDRIQIGEHMGDVIDIGLLAFTMLEIGGDRIGAEQSTGRVIHVPNGDVFDKPQINSHQGLPLLWNEMPVLVTFESNWQKAKAILVELVNQLAPDVSEQAKQYARRADRRFVINYGNVKPTVYTAVADSGVLLTLRYMVNPRKRRSSEQILWEAILTAFAEHWDIDFAYPTQREYIHFQERKRPPKGQESPPLLSETQELMKLHGRKQEAQDEE